jgi:hypothetical protein
LDGPNAAGAAKAVLTQSRKVAKLVFPRENPPLKWWAVFFSGLSRIR